MRHAGWAKGFLAVAVALAPAGTQGACSAVTAVTAAGGNATEATSPPDPSPLSPEQERRLGANIGARLAGELPGAPPAVQSYFREILSRLAPAAKADRPDATFAFKVIDGPSAPNAFSTPSGTIYVHAALIARANDDAEVAALIAHEMSHVVHRHPLARLVRQLGLPAVAALAADHDVIAQDPHLAETLTAVTAGLLEGGPLLANQPAEEMTADADAARYLAQAGFAPGALRSFMLAVMGPNQSPFKVFLGGHPPTPDRLAHLPIGSKAAGVRSAELVALKDRFRAVAHPSPSAAPPGALVRAAEPRR